MLTMFKGIVLEPLGSEGSDEFVAAILQQGV